MKIIPVSSQSLTFGWGDQPSGRKKPQTQQSILWSLTSLVIIIVATFAGLGFWIYNDFIIPNQPITSVNGQTIPQSDYHKLVVFKAQRIRNTLDGPNALIAQQATRSTKVASDLATIGSLNAQLSSTTDPDEKAKTQKQIDAAQRRYNSDNAHLTTLQSKIAIVQTNRTQSQIANESVNWLQDDLIIRKWLDRQKSSIQDQIKPSASQVDSAMKQFIAEMPVGSTYDQFQSKYSVSDKDMRDMVTLKLRRDHLNDYLRGLITSPTRQIKARALTFSTAKDAQDAFKQLQSGADFAELAKNQSADTMTKSKGGELGWLIRWQYTVNNSSNRRRSGAIDNWLFDPTRKVHELSPVLKENGTHYILYIEEIAASRNVDPHTLDTLRANDTPLLAWLNSQEVGAQMTPGNASMEFNATNMPQDIPTSPPSPKPSPTPTPEPPLTPTPVLPTPTLVLPPTLTPVPLSTPTPVPPTPILVPLEPTPALAPPVQSTPTS